MKGNKKVTGELTSVNYDSAPPLFISFVHGHVQRFDAEDRNASGPAWAREENPS